MKYWIWLTQIPYVGCITANQLLSHFGSPQAVYEAFEEDLNALDRLTARQRQSILNARSLDYAEKTLASCARMGISVLTRDDPRYLSRAADLRDAPAVVYYQGTPEIMTRVAGIVGARRCSLETKSFCYEQTAAYIEKKFTIVSGMAKGIDACAHTLCLQKGAATAAILGNGLDYCYPSEHRKLMDEIRAKGLLLSEYPPGTLPSVYTFPRRNRLIAAWAEELQVIAAGKGSGARITAEFARQYGRKVIWC